MWSVLAVKLGASGDPAPGHRQLVQTIVAEHAAAACSVDASTGAFDGRQNSSSLERGC